ncbi:hypothetical protein [Sphingobium indicum]|uniref:hypothetical protein n=1 Tax=Sphingobium indicum TaxID=332055 RepID=UPI0030B8C5D6
MRNVSDADLVQFRRGEKPPKPAADHQRVDAFIDRVADQRPVDIGIIDIAAEIARHLDILAVSPGIEALRPFLHIFPAEEVDVDLLIGHIPRQGCHYPLLHPSH